VRAREEQERRTVIIAEFDAANLDAMTAEILEYRAALAWLERAIGLTKGAVRGDGARLALAAEARRAAAHPADVAASAR
jgi:hypothetical protein